MCHRYPRSEAPRGYSFVVSDAGLISSARRFRFGGKKEGAGAAVAVIQMGTMEIECGLVYRPMFFGAAMLAAGDEKWRVVA
jgi:hypothetical protein